MSVAELRAITYLAPSIPLEFFEIILEALGAGLSLTPSLAMDTRISGPLEGDADPFRDGSCDLGFVCAPSFLWLRNRNPSSVALVRAAPVFRHAHAAGRPVYFAEIIVERRDGARTFADLAGRSFSYNDPNSLSGYFSVLEKLHEMGRDRSFFSEMTCSGSHLRSLERVSRGEMAAAAIDSVTLALCRRDDPSLDERVRVLETWGPFPIQPIVARTDFAAAHREDIARILLSLHETPWGRELRERFGCERFAPTTEEDYERERSALRSCGDLRWRKPGLERLYGDAAGA